VYGIEGTCGEDVVMGVFCTPCVLVHNNREVRARQGGKPSLTNNPEFVEEEPAPQQPMTYGASHFGTNQDVEMVERRGGNIEQSRCASAGNNQGNFGQSAYTSVYEKQNHRSQPQADEHCLDDCVPRARSRQPSRPGNVPKTTQDASTHSSQSISSHELVDCHPSPEVTNNGKEPAPEEHTVTAATIKDSSTAAAKSNSTLESHIEKRIEKQRSSQHTATDCDTITTTSDASSAQHGLHGCSTVPSQVHELSYVHDFTDCPVDKAVLDYYEKEEKIAEQHALTKCARASSANALSSNELVHNLKHCPTDKGVLEYGERNANIPDKHSLTNCARASSANAPFSNELVHDLKHCPNGKEVVEYGEKEENFQKKHSLTKCARVSSASARSSNESFAQHALPDCAANITASRAGTNKQDTCVVDAIGDDNKNHRQGALGHHLLNCPTPSEGADDRQDVDYHRLSSCIYDDPRLAAGSDDSQATQRPSTKSKGKGKELVMIERWISPNQEKHSGSTKAKQYKDDQKRLQHDLQDELEHHSKKSKLKTPTFECHGKDGPHEETLSQPSGSQENPFESNDYKNDYIIIDGKSRRLPKDSAQHALSQALGSRAGKENFGKGGRLEGGRKSEARKTKSDEGSRAALPEGEGTRGQLDVSRSEEEQKGQGGGVTGL
jgi:hypothetical protein